MLSSIGRAAVRRVVAGRPQSTNRATHHIWQLHHDTLSKAGGYGLLSMSRRSYASAVKAVVEPKSKSTTAKAKTSANPAAKKASTKESTKVAAKKPAKKPLKKKLVKPKKVTKKILTPEQKERQEVKALKQEVKALKEQALTVPKRKPDNAWQVYCQVQIQQLKDTPGSIGAKMPMISQSFKDLSPSELESLNHTANQNKSENDVSFREWVESHTPDVINRANNARRLLARKYNKRGHPISDPRIPKRGAHPLSFFLKERYASGDMKGITVGEASKLIATEWNALSPSDRKPYEDLAAKDKLRYVQEYKTTFHEDPLFVRRPKSASPQQT